jgi:hypothetical protein
MLRRLKEVERQRVEERVDRMGAVSHDMEVDVAFRSLAGLEGGGGKAPPSTAPPLASAPMLRPFSHFCELLLKCC